jgi:hypothetical protein
MKIEVFSEELNSKIRGSRINGERLKQKMEEILERLSISQISDGRGGFVDEDTKLLLMMLQIVWNEKEELAEKVKKLETGILEVGMNDHKTIALSGLNED